MSAISGISLNATKSGSIRPWQASPMSQPSNTGQSVNKVVAEEMVDISAAAQNASATLQNNPSWQDTVTSAVNAANSGNNFNNAFASLGQALQAGNVEAEQSAATQIQAIFNTQQSDNDYNQNPGKGQNQNSNTSSQSNWGLLPENSTISVYA
jgi:hypothetical protein